MTLHLERAEVLGLALGFGFAALIGLLAGVNPELAVAGALAVVYVLITLADLRVGLALFVAIIFFETIAVLPGLGLAKPAGGALALSWLAKIVTDPASRRFIWSDYPGFTAAVVAFLAWTVVSAAWAPEPARALDNSFRFLLNAALLPIVYTAVRTPRDARMVLTAFVIGAGVTAAIGILSPPTEGMEGRLTGTIGDPNEFAATLAAGFMLAVGISFTTAPGSIARLSLRLTAALCLFALLLTLSRGGLVALVAALFLAPFLARHRLRAASAVAAFLIAAVILVASLAPDDAVDRFTARDGGSGRTDIWKVAIRMIDDSPIIGIGGGNFISSASDYVLFPGALHEKKTLISEGSVAHNIYLEIWAEVGLVGLLLFLTVLIGCLGAAVTASRQASRAGKSATATLYGSLALAVIALATAYFFLSEQHGNKFWVLLALCPAILSLQKNENDTPDHAEN